MTNAEKFKEDFGFELKNIGSYEDGYYCIDSDADIECKTCPLYEKGCSHVAFINWWNSRYKGEPTIPLSVIEKIKAEIDKEISECVEQQTQGSYLIATGLDNANEIIDKAVKECTHETRRISDCSHGN